MLRKLKFQSKGFDPVPEQAPKFAVGDCVHAVDDGEIGTVEYLRRDGLACIQWRSGTREWVHQSVLCGSLVR
jgi:hypothetical protein